MSNFTKSLKPRVIEEWLDFYFYRRLAHFLLPFFIKLKFSPNQISTLSMSTGFLASYMVLKQHFVASACLVILTIVFDCCDGQVARLTGQTSPLGRIVDGVCDFLWILAYWLCLYFSGYFGSDKFLLYFMIVSGAGVAIHCWRYDGAKVFYLEMIAENPENQDIDDAKKLFMDSAKKFDVIGTVLGFFMFIQMFLFVRGKGKKKTYNLSPAQKLLVKEKLEHLVSLWTWLGESHHNTALLLGVMFMGVSKWPILIVFTYILIPLNIYYLILEIKWQRSLKEVRREVIK